MSRWVALLRGVNVGGNRKVPMRSLLAMLGDLDLRHAQTLLQSGNAVFTSDETDAQALRSRLEEASLRQFGAHIPFHLRTADAWERAIENNPLPELAATSPSRFLLFTLRHEPAAAALAALRQSNPGGERIEARGRELYVHYVDGIGTSKLDNARIDRFLRAGGDGDCTGRNWNTVLKLQALVRRLPS